MDQSLFDKLAAAEEEFYKSEFLSPVLCGRPVAVRVEGIVLRLKVQPKKFEGWGVFRVWGKKAARFRREPTMIEKRRYLDLYPRFMMIICQTGDRVLGLPANADGRIKINGLVPIFLTEGVRRFDTVDVRFDGDHFWFDRASASRSARTANALRDFLGDEKESDEVELPGLSKEERLAYRIAYNLEIESKKDRTEERIQGALQRGGAVYRSYVERGDTYTVEYTVDGRNHRSTVDRNTLQVVTAGICLTDHATGVSHDSDFDLQSLVSVLREGEGTGRIYRMGGNRR